MVVDGGKGLEEDERSDGGVNWGGSKLTGLVESLRVGENMEDEVETGERERLVEDSRSKELIRGRSELTAAMVEDLDFGPRMEDDEKQVAVVV